MASWENKLEEYLKEVNDSNEPPEPSSSSSDVLCSLNLGDLLCPEEDYEINLPSPPNNTIEIQELQELTPTRPLFPRQYIHRPG